MGELLIAAEIIFSLLGLFVLVIIYRQGLFSPVFLITVHLYLGCVVRYFYLLFDGGRKLHYVVGVRSVSFWELQLFFWVFTIFVLYIFKGNKVKGFSALRVKEVDKRRFTKVLTVSLICVGIYLIIMVASFGGLFVFISASINRVSDNVQGLAYAGVLLDLAIAGSLFLFIYYRKVSYRHKVISAAFVFLIIVLLGALGGRGNFIQYLLSIFIIADCVKGKITRVNYNILIVAMVFLLMSTAGLAIRKASQQEISFKYAISDVSESFVGSVMSPFSLFDHYELAKVYAEDVGFDYGIFYLEQFTRPIPRALWHEKPQVLGKKIRNEFWGDETGGVPAGYIGESFIGFGLLGVFFSAILLAFITRILQGYYMLSLIKPEFAVFVAIVTPYVSFNLIRTGVDTAFTRIAIYAFAFMLFKVITDYKFKWK